MGKLKKPILARVIFFRATTMQKTVPPLVMMAVTVLLALSSLACQTRILGVDVGFATPTSTLAPIATHTRVPGSSPTPTLPATLSASGKVCFENLEGGILRVRECPGLSCGEVEVIENGTVVQATGERRDVDNTTWLLITSPVRGWVSSKFICNEGR